MLKISVGVVAALAIVWGIGSIIVPALLNPEQGLKNIAKRVAAGPSNPSESMWMSQQLATTLERYLTKFGELPAPQLNAELRKLLPSSAFEVYVANLPHQLKIVEVDTLLHGNNYLLMHTSGGTKVFPIRGLEVYDDSRIIADAAGPMLVVLGHSGGQPPHSPQVKVYALLPDDVSDESEKSAPPITGQGSAKFVRNSNDIVADMSLFSIGKAQKLFNEITPRDESTVHQYLSWKDGKYTLYPDPGFKYPLSAVYAVAQCMQQQQPEDLRVASLSLGPVGTRFIREHHVNQPSNFKIERLRSTPNKVRYVLTADNNDKYVILVSHASKDVWHVAATSAGNQGENKSGQITAGSIMKDVLAINSTPEAPKPPEAIPPAAPPSKPVRVAVKPPVEKKRAVEAAKPPVEKKKSVGASKSVVVDKKHNAGKKKPVQAPPPAKSKVIKKKTTAKDFTTASAKKPKTPKSAKESTSSMSAEISRQLPGKTVKLRSNPSTGSRIVTELPRGGSIQIVGKKNGWYKIRSGGKEGFVYGGLVDYKRPDSYTTATVVKAYSIKDAKHRSVLHPQVGERLIVVGGIKHNKYQVQLSNGKTGYVDKSALDVSTGAPQFVP